MAEVLFVLLLIVGVLGAILIGLWRRGFMRNGYFTIGTSVIIAMLMMATYQMLPAAAMQFLPGNLIENRQFLLSLNMISQMVVLVGGSLLLIRATEQDIPATLRLEGIAETPARLYVLGPPIMLLTTAVSGAITEFWTRGLKYLPFYTELEKLQALNEELVKKLTIINSPADFILIMLAIAIVPSIAEEVFFRGFLQTNIERSGHRHARPYIALVIASVIFALVHFSPLQFPGLLGLGLAMGYMSYRTNNLLVGSIAHAFNNGSAVLAIAQTGNLPDESAIGELTIGSLLLVIIGAGTLLALAIYLFHRWSEPIQARHYAEEEVQATRVYYATQELERLNEEMLAKLEASEQAKRKELNDH